MDVEEHFHANVFDRVVPISQWDRHPSRVVANTDRLLELLAAHQVTATCFTVGWVAERFPGLIRRMAAQGHELASHTWWHRRVFAGTPEQFREDVRRSKALLEDQAGTAILGFRAPSFSIRPGCEWAFDILLEEGYRYDSSIFPIRRPGYGYPGAPAEPYYLSRPAGRLLEIPMATWSVLGLRVPAAGGGYLRQLPLGVIRHAFRQLERRGSPGMFYVHPWEIDPDQPRLPVGTLSRIRHYRNLERTLPALETLLGEFRFGSVRDWLAGGTFSVQ